MLGNGNGTFLAAATYPGEGQEKTPGTTDRSSLSFTGKRFVLYIGFKIRGRPLGSATEHSSIGCIDKELTKRPFVSCGLIADFF